MSAEVLTRFRLRVPRRLLLRNGRSLRPDVIDWFTETVGEARWELRSVFTEVGGGYCVAHAEIGFEDEVAAVVFALRWLGEDDRDDGLGLADAGPPNAVMGVV